MTAALPPTETLADAVALIAVCKSSVALMEVALALQVVATGKTEVPAEARGNRVFARVHRRLTVPVWRAAARAALTNEGLARVAGCFYAGCFEYAKPKTATPYDDEEWLRAIQLFYLLEENMRALADMILDLMRLPEVDVEPRQAPAANPRPAAPVASTSPAPVAAPQPAVPPQPAPQPRMEAPPAEWAIPIALIALGKAERNPLWVSFGATVGCLSGFWSHEPKLAADPRFSVAAKKMLEAPRGFEMASALLHDPALRAASQAMMGRWYAVTGGNVSSDGLRDVKAIDAELAVMVSGVLRATCAVLMAVVKANPAASSAKVASEPPPRPLPAEPSKPAATAGAQPRSANIRIRPPALRFVPARATAPRPLCAPFARRRQVRLPARARNRIPDVDSYAMQPLEPRSRSPPQRSLRPLPSEEFAPRNAVALPALFARRRRRTRGAEFVGHATPSTRALEGDFDGHHCVDICRWHVPFEGVARV